MKKIRLVIIFLVTVMLFAVVMVHAQPNKELQSKEVKQKALSVLSKDKLEPVSIPNSSVVKGSKQGYRMVTDVLDAFGGESQSTNYRVPVNSGGQPSATGISQSDHYLMKTGYVHASSVMRGDSNNDGLINSADVVYLINYLFVGGPAPQPLEAGDANCDGTINSADVAYVINYLFIGGPPPDC